jgi:hypothetical protein
MALSGANSRKVALAFVAAPAAAVVTLAFLVFVFWPGNGADSPPHAALGFAIYGAIIIFPISIVGGVPLYLLFRFKSWLSRAAVFLGSVVLSLAYPIFVALENPLRPGLVTAPEYLVSVICGLVAAWVFCRIVGLSSKGN